MEFKKGDQVIHPNMPEWDTGQVLEDNKGDIVRVYFVGVGDKKINFTAAGLKKVATEPHPILDNLPVDLWGEKPSGKKLKYQGLMHYTTGFTDMYPRGFNNKKYLEEERRYKWDAHELMHELLGSETFASLLNTEQYSEICERAGKVVNKTNLIFPNENMSLRDGLKNPSNQKLFAGRLYELVYGKGSLESRFEGFAKCLREMDADKWTTQTYFLFIAYPKDFMFMKPEVTKQAAKACGFELNYKPELNWLTYQQLLKLSKYLFEKLSDLNPRDMIDIQSFIWCSGEAAK